MKYKQPFTGLSRFKSSDYGCRGTA